MTSAALDPPIPVRHGAAVLAAYATDARDDRDATSPPLVFLHAGVCDARMWRDEFDAFGDASRRVVAFDRRGFGRTPAAGDDYANVDDLFAVLDALDVPRAILVGCSQGCRIALDAQAAAPARVAGLVLVAGAIGGAPVRDVDARVAALDAAIEAADARGDVDEVVRLDARLWLDGPFSPEGRVGGDARARFVAMDADAVRAPETGRAEVPDTAWARLPTIPVPTLVVNGLLDVPHVVANMRHAAATIPGARSLELPDCAHLPNLERPDLFLPALASFVRDVH